MKNPDKEIQKIEDGLLCASPEQVPSLLKRLLKCKAKHRRNE